jgi:HNH endonuclease
MSKAVVNYFFVICNKRGVLAMKTEIVVPEFKLLHREAVEISKNLHHQEYLMVEVLQKIDEKKVYRTLGFKSLYQYTTVALRLSPGRAYNFIQVSRKARNLSRFQEALKKGEITLSKAKRVTSVINEENEKEWIDLSKNLSQRNLERAVAKVNPRSSVEEGTRFVSESLLELKAAISLDTDQILKRVQDLLCQSKGGVASMDEAFRAMGQLYLKMNDPVIKAQRVLSKKIKGEHSKQNIQEIKDQGISETIKNSPQRLVNRKPLAQYLKHQVNLRDQGKCQDPTCEDRRWIDMHHIIPVSQGGQNILENLITLCSGHHALEHLHSWR